MVDLVVGTQCVLFKRERKDIFAAQATKMFSLDYISKSSRSAVSFRGIRRQGSAVFILK